jgi:hypothetical protein
LDRSADALAVGGPATAAFLDEDFLTVADRTTIHQALMDAALQLSGAERVDLQRYEPHTHSLRIAAQHGLPASFLAFFATVEADTPTARAAALTT